jgi:hypothetical protein
MSLSTKKVNIPGLSSGTFGANKKTTGIASQATQNLTGSSALSKSSLFSLKKGHRSNFVAGEHVTKGKGKYDYTRLRNNANPRVYTPKTYTSSYGTNYTNYNVSNGSNSYITGQVVGQVLSQGISLLNQLGAFGGSSSVQGTGNSSSVSSTLNQFVNGNSNLTGGVSSSYSGQLSSASSFNELNSLQQNVDTKMASLDKDYKSNEPKSDVDKLLSDADVSAGLQDAGVNLDTSALTLSSLNSDNLEESIKTVDSDYAKIGNFKTNDLVQAKTSISTKAGQVKGTIAAKEGELSRLEASNTDGQNTAAITKLKNEIEELKKEQEKLEKAQTAIDNVSKRCDEALTKLEQQKSEIKDLKSYQDKVQDKKYNLAKTQKQALAKALDKVKKYDAEIKKASVDKNGSAYNKSDEKRENKLNKLISERNAATTQMSSLISSLSAAGDTKISSSKGQSCDFSSELKEAINYQAS